MVDIDVLVDVKTELGEGPLWDAGLERLFWIDSKGCKVYRSTASGGEVRAWDVPAPIGSMALRKDGAGAIVALGNGLHALDFGTGEVEFLQDPEPGRSENRLNDGKVDPRGRFLFGSMNLAEDEPTASLYSLGTDFSVRTLETELLVSNGPCWSPDGSTFYFSDTYSGEIWAYDYDLETGAISNRRVFARIDRATGAGTDGSTVDSEGYLWNSLVFVGRIVRYAPDGSVDRVVDLPVTNATSIMFGGPELDTLFVTSMSKQPLAGRPEDPPSRGSVFAVTGLGVTGLPEHRFGA